MPFRSRISNILQQPAGGLRFTLTLWGMPEQTFAVLDYQLMEAYSMPFTLQLTLVSADPAVDFAAVLEEDACFTIWRGQEAERHVNGVVEYFEQGDTGKNQTLYTMTVRPRMYSARYRRNCRIFQQEDIANILNVILEESGPIEHKKSFLYAHPIREYCVQYNESNTEFFNRICAEEGIYSYYTFEDGRHQLILADEPTQQCGEVELPYNASEESKDTTLCVSSFRRAERVRTAQVQLKDYTFKNPQWPGKFTEKGEDDDIQYQWKGYQYYDYPGRFKTDGRGDHFTFFRLHGLRNDAHAGVGVSNCAALMPGKLLKLTSHPREDLNTLWQIVSVRHSGQQPGALTEGSGSGGGTTQSSEFTFIPQNQNWRPAPPAKPTVFGPQIATVVGPEGQEIFTDKFGRVRVHFPWDRQGKSDGQDTCWIRVSQQWAGAGWGGMAIPRIGQEVIVDFLDGDPDQPIITGRTYNAHKMPPLDLPIQKTRMTIRSKTHQGEGFNELTFEDAKDREQVFIHAQKDMNTQVLNDRTTSVVANDSERVGGNQKTVVAKDQNMRVEGNQTVLILKDKDLTIEGGNSVITHKDRDSTILGNETISVKGNILIEGNGNIEIGNGYGKIIIDKIGNIFIKGNRVSITEYSGKSKIIEALLAERDWIEISLVNDYGTPIPYEKYRLTTPDGEVIIGSLDEEGKARIENIAAGVCDVVFPDLKKKEQ